VARLAVRLAAVVLTTLASATASQRRAIAAQPAYGDTQEAHDAAYDRWFSRRNQPVHGARIVLESLGVLVVGTAYYWSDPLANEEDWDDPAVVDKLRFKQRAASFDTNLNPTNHLLHPGAGAFTFGLARDNGLSVPGAFALTATSSVLWELGLEWREKASYNDLVYTTFGGVVVGNFFQRLGAYVNSTSTSGSAPRVVASYVLGAPRKLHAALDDEDEPEDSLPRDALGYSRAFSHRFHVGYELASLRNDLGDRGALHRIRLGGEIAAMPGMGEPGSFSRRFGEANFTSLSATLGFGSRATDDEADVQGMTTLAGEYRQSYSDRTHGHATMIGFGPGYRFQTSEWLGRRDQLSTVHLLGPQLTGWLASGIASARLDASAHADFASLRSLAYEIYPEPFDATRIKGVLERQGYTYDAGVSARVRASGSIGPISLEGSAAYGRYGSIEGYDRRQARITTEVHGTEEVLESGVTLRARLLDVVELSAFATERRRTSTLGPYEVSRWDRSLGVGAGLVF
jgi:hypothetical protein